jgi:hypothetical protein
VSARRTTEAFQDFREYLRDSALLSGMHIRLVFGSLRLPVLLGRHVELVRSRAQARV